jgi:hypothetical protein
MPIALQKNVVSGNPGSAGTTFQGSHEPPFIRAGSQAAENSTRDSMFEKARASSRAIATLKSATPFAAG